MKHSTNYSVNNTLYTPAVSFLTLLENISYMKIQQLSACVATCCGLDGVEIESRGVSNSAPVQTGSGAHPPSYAMVIENILGVKSPGRGVDNPNTCSAEIRKRVEL
jgi:hypothetical protein